MLSTFLPHDLQKRPWIITAVLSIQVNSRPVIQISLWVQCWGDIIPIGIVVILIIIVVIIGLLEIDSFHKNQWWIVRCLHLNRCLRVIGNIWSAVVAHSIVIIVSRCFNSMPISPSYVFLRCQSITKTWCISTSHFDCFFSETICSSIVII